MVSLASIPTTSSSRSTTTSLVSNVGRQSFHPTLGPLLQYLKVVMNLFYALIGDLVHGIEVASIRVSYRFILGIFQQQI
jgi:hypothetical protein